MLGRAQVCGSRINTKKLAHDIAEELAPKSTGPVPTLDEFFPRFVKEYAQANRHKPRGVEAKESHFRIHLSPRFGSKRLCDFIEQDIQALKLSLSRHKPKSVNNVLATLSKLLKVAVRWRIMPVMPLTIDFIRSELGEVGFYDFAQYARLWKEARLIDPRVLGVVLLGGDAGLRRNEMMGLAPTDVSLSTGFITVRHQDWQGRLITTKGNRARVVPMTRNLARCMETLLQEDNRRVLVRDDGSPLSVQTIRTWMGWAQKAAGLPHLGALHVLRHTFCSHLAMRGASTLAIQQLAGHRSMRTTMRYLHLSPFERARAIALLDSGRSCTSRARNNKGAADV